MIDLILQNCQHHLDVSIFACSLFILQFNSTYSIQFISSTSYIRISYFYNQTVQLQFSCFILDDARHIKTNIFKQSVILCIISSQIHWNQAKMWTSSIYLIPSNEASKIMLFKVSQRKSTENFKVTNKHQRDKIAILHFFLQLEMSYPKAATPNRSFFVPHIPQVDFDVAISGSSVW